jgi:hypothetical protein
MAGHTKLEGEWLLLSTAVARIGELSPIYRTFPGYACRDLEIAIRARRVPIRGRSTSSSSYTIRPAIIDWPVDSSHRLDLVHDTLSQRARHDDVTLFLSVEVKWTKKLSAYLRTIAADLLQGTTAVRAPTGTGHRGPVPGTVGQSEADRLLFPEIERLLRDHPGMSSHAAALKLVDDGKVAGGGSRESKAKRLNARFRKERR